MGQIHKIKDEYYIEFTARGLIYQQKAGNDLAKAQELLASIEEKIANGELQTIARDVDLDVFLQEYLKYAKSLYHPATVRRLLSAMEYFKEFISSQCPELNHLSRVTPRVIENYKAFGIKIRKSTKNEFNPAIINLTLLLLREMFEYGIKLGFINDNPTLHVRLLDMKRLRGFQWTDTQMAVFLSNVKRPYKDVLVLMRYAGLRLTEAIDLTWQQVDFNRNVLFIKWREVPLHTQARGVLQVNFNAVIDHKARVFKGLDDDPINQSEIIRHFIQTCRLTGMSEVSISHLRQNFIKELFERGMSLLTIAKILGINDAAKVMLFSDFIPVSREDIFSRVIE